jgi:hypothetical protein
MRDVAVVVVGISVGIWKDCGNPENIVYSELVVVIDHEAAVEGVGYSWRTG